MSGFPVGGRLVPLVFIGAHLRHLRFLVVVGSVGGAVERLERGDLLQERQPQMTQMNADVDDPVIETGSYDSDQSSSMAGGHESSPWASPPACFYLRTSAAFA